MVVQNAILYYRV
ncbi:hypothetical protein Zm00014a_043786 [Zea mays]|uniref:Uncharacterized protein n=1 Tax=Zea mays TaxID=4577 RepID=A0A3L6G2P6_MAIZE|nr:hypothetical protein Zm00014a_043786 [Zea mays]